MATQPQNDEFESSPLPSMPRGVGRPSLYSDEMAEEICERIAEGESLRRICLDDHMPSRMTVMNWLDENPAFLTKHARARERQAEAVNDEIHNTELELRSGLIDSKVARVLIASKQWRASKLKPKVYGEATMLKHANAEGETLRTAIDPSLLSPEECDVLRQLVLASQQRQLAPPGDADYEEVEDEEDR